MRRRLISASSIGLLAGLTFSLPASATTNTDPDSNPPPKPGGTIVNQTPEAIVVTSPSGPTYEVHHHGKNRHGRWECHYFLVGGDDGGFEPTPLFSQGPITPAPQDPVALQCVDENGDQAFLQIFVFDPANPLGPLDVPARAADEAIKLLVIDPPTVRLSPPVGVPQLVGVPTWLWVDDPWVPRQASAMLGGVTATVTATPMSVTWDLGDGSTVTCPGPGTAYDPSRSPGDQHSDCASTFQRRGSHAVTATVTYATGWTATTGEAEPLDEITRATTVAVDVIEAQALIR